MWTKMMRLVGLLLMPAVIVALVVLSDLSPRACFVPTNISAANVEVLLSQKLATEYQQIETFSPIVQFGNWFKYDVFLRNDYKFTISDSKTGSSTIATSTMVIISSNSATTTISFGGVGEIATNLDLKQIPNLISKYWFSNPTPLFSTLTVISPTDLHFAVSQKWPICIFILLDWKYVPLMYGALLVFEVAFLVMLKEITAFTNKGWKYFWSE